MSRWSRPMKSRNGHVNLMVSGFEWIGRAKNRTRFGCKLLETAIWGLAKYHMLKIDIETAKMKYGRPCDSVLSFMAPKMLSLLYHCVHSHHFVFYSEDVKERKGEKLAIKQTTVLLDEIFIGHGYQQHDEEKGRFKYCICFHLQMVSKVWRSRTT